MSDPKGVPIADYARPIYESWDARGLKPPEGYDSWMAYHADEGWNRVSSSETTDT